MQKEVIEQMLDIVQKFNDLQREEKRVRDEHDAVIRAAEKEGKDSRKEIEILLEAKGGMIE